MLAKAEEASSNREWSIDELMEKGRAVYNKHCSACHQLEGEGLEPAFPALDGSAIVNGPTSEMIMLVLNGKNMMPAWKDILNDTEIGAAMTYTRNSWGNTVKDVVQPADVKATR
jgi:cytochrome c oxidase subunit 2